MENLQQPSTVMNLENHNSVLNTEKTTENTLDNFVFYEEIKKLEKKIEEWEAQRKSYAKLMFTIPTISLGAGFALSIGVAIFSTLENLTIQNFIEIFMQPINLYSFYVVPILLGLYYSWATGTTDYQAVKRILNIASLQLHFLKNNQENIRSGEDLEKLFEKLTKYGEKMDEYIKKYKKGKWGMPERESLAKDGIDTQSFENYLEEYTRKRNRTKGGLD